jgi:hypothetical protein
MNSSFPCPDCSYVGSYPQALAYHIKSHLPSQFSCHCGYSCKTRQMLQSHTEAVHLDANYPCPECDFKAKSESKLLLHTLAFHNLTKGLFCQECKRGFKRKKELKRHVESIHLNKKYECEDCGQKFTRQDSVRRHARVHLNIRPSGRGRVSIQRTGNVQDDALNIQDLEIPDHHDDTHQAFDMLLEVAREMPTNINNIEQDARLV